MDTETIELVRQLCTRAGWIMEGSSVIALVWDDGLSLDQRWDTLAAASDQIAALIAAAKALH